MIHLKELPANWGLAKSANARLPVCAKLNPYVSCWHLVCRVLYHWPGQRGNPELAGTTWLPSMFHVVIRQKNIQISQSGPSPVCLLLHVSGIGLGSTESRPLMGVFWQTFSLKITLYKTVTFFFIWIPTVVAKHILYYSTFRFLESPLCTDSSFSKGVSL